ncbi:F-box domain-containing protein [Psidium guajava]|nr:F-box domain-containing protein [Psidium guajava]
MAGLQYYFFPTDFFYPRAPSPSPADGAAAKAVLPAQALKGSDGGDGFARQKSPPWQPSSASTSAASSSSLLALSRSTIERELRRGRPIIVLDTPKQA